MREFLVRIVAIVSGTLMLLLALAFAWLQNRQPAMSPVLPAPQEQITAGEELYRKLDCARCHSIAGEGNQRAPLDRVALRHDELRLRDWILALGAAEPALPKSAVEAKQFYRALDEEELAALVAFLQGLVQPPKGGPDREG